MRSLIFLAIHMLQLWKIPDLPRKYEQGLREIKVDLCVMVVYHGHVLSLLSSHNNADSSIGVDVGAFLVPVSLVGLLAKSQFCCFCLMFKLVGC